MWQNNIIFAPPATDALAMHGSKIKRCGSHIIEWMRDWITNVVKCDFKLNIKKFQMKLCANKICFN